MWQVSSASPCIAKEFEDTLQSFSSGAPINISKRDVDAWRRNSTIANLLARLSPPQSQHLHETPSIVSSDPPPNDSGILEMDEHSVIRYLGPTSGLHLVSDPVYGTCPSFISLTVVLLGRMSLMSEWQHRQ